MRDKDSEMKTKLYFRNEDSERCHPKEYFISDMRDAGLTEIEVFEAIPDKDKNYFFCDAIGEVAMKEGGYFNCGKECEDYAPCNGKSGKCRYKSFCYTHGEKVTLKFQPLQRGVTTEKMTKIATRDLLDFGMEEVTTVDKMVIPMRKVIQSIDEGDFSICLTTMRNIPEFCLMFPSGDMLYLKIKSIQDLMEFESRIGDFDPNY